MTASRPISPRAAGRNRFLSLFDTSCVRFIRRVSTRAQEGADLTGASPFSCASVTLVVLCGRLKWLMKGSGGQLSAPSPPLQPTGLAPDGAAGETFEGWGVGVVQRGPGRAAPWHAGPGEPRGAVRVGVFGPCSKRVFILILNQAQIPELVLLVRNGAVVKVEQRGFVTVQEQLHKVGRVLSGVHVCSGCLEGRQTQRFPPEPMTRRRVPSTVSPAHNDQLWRGCSWREQRK